MKFDLALHIEAPVDAVTSAFADPALYEWLGGLPKIGTPEVLSHERDSHEAHLRIRYRFTGDLSSAARAVLDPAKLTWVEDSRHDLAAQTVTFRLEPDHYADRFQGSGRHWFEADGDGTRWLTSGEIKVRALLVAGAVERAIVFGLREHAVAQTPVVEAFVTGNATGG